MTDEERIDATLRLYGETREGKRYLDLQGGSLWYVDAAGHNQRMTAYVAPEEAREAAMLRIGAMMRYAFPRFADATVNGWQVGNDAFADVRREIKSQIIAWTKETAARGSGLRTLVLAGAPGCGKTHLACAVATGLVRLGTQPNTQGQRWIAPTLDAWNAGELVKAHRATWRDARLMDPIPRAIKSDILMLDELGVQRGTAETMRTLYEVIDGRYRRGDGVMILPTNATAVGTIDETFWRSLLSGDDEASPHVDRIASRLSENATVIPFGRMTAGGFESLPDWRKEGIDDD